ncbi:MAG: DUF3187 family protein [Thermoanaerobaculaceae bacterium]|nr:DUF3187 family protein [Thermoanaerobaculaceae bacterium]MDI9621224.1 DUF3187 family protein [Acidobacteriota bacterium]NLH11598.1 DUF3187 family protein [Holophagae bacterium]HPW56388.1 DUF3187 family protein [Thermoanaerobaculaceae bacterium]
MRVAVAGRRWWLGGGLVLGACSALAQVPSWPAATFPDPLRFSSLPLNAAEATAPPPGRWQVMSTTGYFNVWQLTWHTGTIHKGWGLLGTPLTSPEVENLAVAFPQDQFFHVDIEGVRSDLLAAYGLPHGLAVVLQVPWIAVGSPRWDAVPERFHASVGIDNMRRDYFPRGRTTVLVRGHHQTICHLDNQDAGHGLGDLTLSLSGRLGTWLGATHRWVASVEAPTGERGTLRGSGGWDSGVRWFATWGEGRRETRLGLGYTFLDPNGSWLGVERDDTWHAQLDLRRPLTGAVDWRLALRFDASPLATFTDSDIGDRSFYWLAGVLVPVGGTGFVAFDLGENYPSTAHVPDFSFHLSFGLLLGQRR